MRDIEDAEMPIVFDHKPERTIDQGIKELEEASILIGHNIIGYDVPFDQGTLPRVSPQRQAR